MSWRKRPEKNYKKSQIALSLILLGVFIVVALVFWEFYYSESARETDKPTQSQTTQTNDNENVQQQQEPEFDAVALQSAVNNWIASTGGTASVVVTNTSGNVLAENNREESYFAASLYKLFVAYFGYQQIDSGEVDEDEMYLNGNTRGQCLDLMIRESNSPCAEKLWTELGKQELTNKLVGLGISNTSMTSLTTTAEDTAKILKLIENSNGLSQASRLKYKDSMLDQPATYRRGLPSGFSESVSVYNKVGWNENIEWHDSAIIELPDGRKLIVTVLTKSVGSKNIARLATALESAATH